MDTGISTSFNKIKKMCNFIGMLFLQNEQRENKQRTN